MRSMTGYGEAALEEKDLTIKTEIKSVNHRFFILKMNLPELLNGYSSRIEELIKKFVLRGAVNLAVRIDSAPNIETYQLNSNRVQGYYKKLRSLQRSLKIKGDISMQTLMLLPGVLDSEVSVQLDAVQTWTKIQRVIKSAAADLVKMRRREGKRLQQNLKKILTKMSQIISKIESRAGQVTTRYEKKLRARIEESVKKFEVAFDNHLKQNLAHEIAVFAQRADITEELHRLKSHIKEFSRTMEAPNETGKKLDFITQEMLREGNTIGAKANNPEIAQLVVTLKCEVEKLKEQVQNIE